MKKYFFIIELFFASVFFFQGWKAIYAEAIKKVQQQAKLILLDIAGLDWCSPCIKLGSTLRQSDVFQNYAAAKLPVSKADFPRKKANRLTPTLTEQNGTLAGEINPTIASSSFYHSKLVSISKTKRKRNDWSKSI